MAPRLPPLLHLEGVASVLPHKRADNLIKLRRILQPHKVAAAVMRVEDLDPRPGNLLANPLLRLGGEEARSATGRRQTPAAREPEPTPARDYRRPALARQRD